MGRRSLPSIDPTTTIAVAFGSALLGALAGGFASSVGSIVVARRELARKARIDLHDNLLPSLEQILKDPLYAFGSNPEGVRAGIELIIRKCDLIGGTEQRLAHDLQLSAEAVISAVDHSSVDDYNDVDPKPGPHYADHLAGFNRALETLSHRTGDKIR